MSFQMSAVNLQDLKVRIQTPESYSEVPNTYIEVVTGRLHEVIVTQLRGRQTIQTTVLHSGSSRLCYMHLILIMFMQPTDCNHDNCNHISCVDPALASFTLILTHDLTNTCVTTAAVVTVRRLHER